MDQACNKLWDIGCLENFHVRELYCLFLLVLPVTWKYMFPSIHYAHGTDKLFWSISENFWTVSDFCVISLHICEILKKKAVNQNSPFYMRVRYFLKIMDFFFDSWRCYFLNQIGNSSLNLLLNIIYHALFSL